MLAPPRVLKKRGTGASVLVLACIDPRFVEFLSLFLAYQVWADYDLFTLAGASLGVLQSGASNGGIDNPDNDGPDWPPPNGTVANVVNNADWAGVFYDHIVLALALHNISEVWVFDHLDCGAYKYLQFGFPSSDDETAPHVANLTSLQTLLENDAKFSSLKFKGFIIELDGKILNPINDGTGISLVSNKYNWNAFWAFTALLFGLWITLFVFTRPSR